MIPAALQTAVALAWTQFQADTKLSPDKFNDVERMVFQAAFVAGANWALETMKEKA